MTYQRTIEELDEAGQVEWEYCYVCGGQTFLALTDLFVGPTHHYDKACKRCQKHGAPHYQPKDWTQQQSKTVLAKCKAAEPPPPKPHPLTKDEKERNRRISKIISRMF